ncbi:MAG: phosphoribosylamine--glycine ligase [Clostridiales Family XIII bacterium]|nr:phosphoribosylamine--glycine ligase [Clostridiales Family XIII bacterium]
MKVLIVGGGGREHAIAWKLKQSPLVTEIVCAPGNGGIAEIARCIPVQAEDLDGIVALAEKELPDLAVIGPETPLALGITDRLEALGVKVFGPNKKCAQLEASKSFTKRFLERHGIPTARYREYTDKDSLMADIGIFGFPMVLKADGLAAGKGVIIAKDRAEAEAGIKQIMGVREFGAAGDRVVVEELLRGTEASVLCFVDESSIIPMESAQDYKRIFDRDEGPNTGGMGNYSPSLLFSDELDLKVAEEILLPTFEGFKKDGLDFRGVLFVGLMLTKDGPKVIEFNNRFGDPETQAVLPRLKTDLAEIMLAVADGRLADTEIDWDYDLRTVCVVMASGGYPGSYEKGKIISGLGSLPEDALVFHAGTRASEIGDLLTDGGRVLGVVGRGGSHEEAVAKAYEGVGRISFEGACYRNDIGAIYDSGE